MENIASDALHPLQFAFLTSANDRSVGYNLAKVICKAKEIAKVDTTVRHNIKPRIIAGFPLCSAKVIGKKEKVVKVNLVPFAGKPSDDEIAIAVQGRSHRH